MARSKIDYGIDLGTTNSAIARMEEGKPVVKKTDLLKDTLPSCVAFSKSKMVLVGDKAYTQLDSDSRLALKDPTYKVNTFIEFKRTMGTDKSFYSTHMAKNYTSEDLSAEVLKRLKAFIGDENINTVVITVPMKFTINQKDATKRAAELAGFAHCELLQEPIAASMAYGLHKKTLSGYWLVFDFGGGTFDAALLKVDDGIMKVIDTEGDNYLGGKNIDEAIVDEIIIPHFSETYAIKSILLDEEKCLKFRNAWKSKAEEGKIQLSFKDSYIIETELGQDYGIDDNGNSFELSLNITGAILESTTKVFFQRAIDLCKKLLVRNNVNAKKLETVILVGGPTYSPIFRRMLKEQLTESIDTSVDPMTVVALGAALYASTIDISKEIIEKTRDRKKVQLSLGYEATTVELEEFITVKILENSSEIVLKGPIYCELERNDKAWSSGKLEINKTGEVIEVKLIENKPNLFDVLLYSAGGDRVDAEPQSITIIQGSKIGSATLPYHIGIDAKSTKTGEVGFTTIKGLEKNQSLPAKGVKNALKTQKQIRPGIKDDFIKIPIYQGDYYAEGTRAVLNEHVYDVIISGEDVPRLLPENSDVDLTLDIDRSEGMTLKAYFPILDHTCEIRVPTNNVQKEIKKDWLNIEIQKAKHQLNILGTDAIISSKDKIKNLNEEINELEKLFEQGKNDYDRKKQVLNNLRQCLKRIDEIKKDSEWPKTEAELKKVFYNLEKVYNDFKGQLQNLDEKKVQEAIEKFKEQIPLVIKEKNVKVAKDIIEQMRSLDFAIVDEGLGAQFEIMMLQAFNENFNTHDWSDRNKARLLINQGMKIAAENPTKQSLRPLIIELYKLLPDVEKKSIFPDDLSLLLH